MTNCVTNVVVAGLGGQGVLKASDILADVAFRSGQDVKKAEIHGMSQRGGSVSSDVRFGDKILSPMIAAGEADYLVVLNDTQVEVNDYVLREGGCLITPADIDVDALENRKSLNVALLGILSRHLDLNESDWLAAIRANLPEKIYAVNEAAFLQGRRTVEKV